jgi:hypothetical protein
LKEKEACKRYKWKNTVKVLKEKQWNDQEQVYLAQDEDSQLATVSTMLNLPVP